jgi:hypothetical protein
MFQVQKAAHLYTTTTSWQTKVSVTHQKVISWSRTWDAPQRHSHSTDALSVGFQWFVRQRGRITNFFFIFLYLVRHQRQILQQENEETCRRLSSSHFPFRPSDCMFTDGNVSFMDAIRLITDFPCVQMCVTADEDAIVCGIQ